MLLTKNNSLLSKLNKLKKMWPSRILKYKRPSLQSGHWWRSMTQQCMNNNLMIPQKIENNLRHSLNTRLLLRQSTFPLHRLKYKLMFGPIEVQRSLEGS